MSVDPSAEGLIHLRKMGYHRPNHFQDVIMGDEVDELTFLILIEKKATWADVPMYVNFAIGKDFDSLKLAEGLQSQKKQAIEILTRVFTSKKSIEVAPALIRLMVEQIDGANSLRARDALINLGEPVAELALKCLDHPNWKVRQYSVQILALVGEPSIVDRVVKVAIGDKSSKVKETALQAIEYWQGEVDPSELDLIPKPVEATD